MPQAPRTVSSQAPVAVSTPCVMVCTIDPTSGLCLGCYRSADEIARWSRFSETERKTIMAQLDARVTRIDPALR